MAGLAGQAVTIIEQIGCVGWLKRDRVDCLIACSHLYFRLGVGVVCRKQQSAIFKETASQIIKREIFHQFDLCTI